MGTADDKLSDGATGRFEALFTEVGSRGRGRGLCRTGATADALRARCAYACWRRSTWLAEDSGPHRWGEEYGTQDGASGLTWVLDPIDGTRGPFCPDAPTFAFTLGVLIQAASNAILRASLHGAPKSAGDSGWSWHRGSCGGCRSRQSGAGRSGSMGLTGLKRDTTLACAAVAHGNKAEGDREDRAAGQPRTGAADGRRVPSSVGRIGPVRNASTKGFKVSTPMFEEKVTEIGAYLDPPDRAVVPWTRSPKSRRSTGPSPGCAQEGPRGDDDPRLQAPRHDHARGLDVIRSGHRRMHAAPPRKGVPDIPSPYRPGGEETARHPRRARYATHKTPEVRAWLEKHPRFKLHFTPRSR